MKIALLKVFGIVQGVGFRPFVHGLATALKLPGWVQNTVEGVLIAVPAEAAENFKRQLIKKSPKLAQIDDILIAYRDDMLPRSFEIRQSLEGEVQTGIVPDAAICAKCIEELNNPSDRRHGYAFLNCTNCGPRFSIIHALPYDRAKTTMSCFAMCDSCAEEFENINNRRFHAQPIACPECGPQIWFEDSTGNYHNDSMDRAVALIKRAGIVALRSVGGFHLACLARDEKAVATLRKRKNRPSKPFAVMVRDMNMARKYAIISSDIEEALLNVVAPIVLAPLATTSDLSPSVLCGLKTIGMMLPYSPLHTILLNHFDEPLVMTSGNIGNAPQLTNNAEAIVELAQIADGFLLHNRDINNRVDDSVIQITSNGPQTLRRARGLAPTFMPLPQGFENHPDAIAFGADLKNAFALAKKEQAILSQHIGDLSDFKTEQDLMRNISLWETLFDVQPKLVICDMHHGYRSTHLAEQYAKINNLPILRVQHHHAHAAALMVENNVGKKDYILALVQDGLGMGLEREIWGAEALEVSYAHIRRIASLKPATMPGGNLASSQPWRNLVARLYAEYGVAEYWPLTYQKLLSQMPTDAVCAAIAQNINAPYASSTGRLFDAIAAALGLFPQQQSFEGEAAMHVQQLAEDWINDHGTPEPYLFKIEDNGMTIIDPAPIWKSLEADITKGNIGLAAARFHVGWAQTWTQIATAQKFTNYIGLTGGSFQNSLLLKMVTDMINDENFNVISHKTIPANDGGIAVGQLAIGLSTMDNHHDVGVI